MRRFLLTGGNGFIGIHLTEALRSFSPGCEVVILDQNPPKITLHENEKWVPANLLNQEAVNEVFAQFKPQTVIHLAAETSCESHMVMEDYLVNTRGSEIVFQACEQYGVDFLVHTSTQFVHQAERMPSSDLDFAPHTIYGESKVAAEKLLRQEQFSFNWVIIRPTNVWGAWHIRYPHEFWKILKQGRYFHPGKRKVLRSYGYVGNVCWQTLELIRRKNDPAVSKQVFYVGDEPVDIYEWVNDFSLSITQKPARILPGSFVYILALTGSALQKTGIRFPITLSRYRSMTTHNPAPMQKTFDTLGKPPYTQKQGVALTTDWLLDFWKKDASNKAV